MVDNINIKKLGEVDELENEKDVITKHFDEEKVEVLIREVIRISPKDFQAFKHALEDFVNSWDK